MENAKNRIEKQPIELVEPSAKYKDSYLEALEECKETDGDDIDIEHERENFDTFLADNEKNKKGQIVDRVPQISYWAVDGDRYIGNINYRPVLNDRLQWKDGNIGYSIRPTERRKGYASLMLKKVLDMARAEGKTSVMLTCDDDNLGSKKVIENAGGVYDSSGEDKGKAFSRYIITLS